MKQTFRKEIGKDISCRITRTLLHYVREKNNGSLGLLLEGFPLREGYLLDGNNWVPHELLQDLYHRMIDILDDENAVYHMTLASERFKSLGFLDRIVRLLGNPRLIYSQAPKYNKYLKLNGSVYIHELRDSCILLEDRYHDSEQKTRFDCDYTRGILAGIPTMFGLPLADVEEIKCQVIKEKYGKRRWPDHPPQGCRGCLYKVRWVQKKEPILKRIFPGRNYHREAIEDLVEANRLIQAKYDEVKNLMREIEGTNRKLRESQNEMEMKKAALVESERKYRLLAENVSDIIWVLDLETLSFDYISPSVEKIRGFPAKEAMGLSLEQTLSPESLAKVTKRLETELANENKPGCDPQRSVTIEIEQSLKEGGYGMAEATVSFLRDASGAPTAIMGVTRDISERKKGEEEKRDLEIKLQRAKKLESLGTLAGGVAHDLNNILSGIVSYPDLLLMDVDENSPFREPLLKIKQSGLKASEIVQDLLTLARRNVANKKVVSLNKIASDFITTLECQKMITGRKDVTITTNFCNEVIKVAGSEGHLSKTLMNLVRNAVDAMPAGGMITISTKNCYLDQPYTGFEVVPQGEYAILKVADTGIGMPPTELEKIFEPFFSNKALGHSGTGLGMPVVWGTIKDHNGFIDIITEEGSGTTFTLYIPGSRSDIEISSSVHIDDYLGMGESILVVDDAPEQRRLAKRMMERLGYEVTTAASGEEAVGLLQERPYEVLVLDMIMPPGMGGLETYKQILEIIPGQKAVIASGYSESKDVREAQRLGAGGYIKKPFTLEGIGLAVRAELDRS